MQKFFISLIAIVAIGGGIWLGASYNTTGGRPELSAVTLLSKDYRLPNFTLTDENGRPFTNANLNGQWSVVFSGFTSCGHFCPMTMGKLKLIYDQLETPPNIVFLSVDPERDSSEVIKGYVGGFDPNFIGITGDPAEISKLTTALEAPWFIDKTDGKYLVDHSSDLILISPRGTYAGFISQPLDTTLIASELNQLFKR
jgi:protein SCO1